MGNLLLRTSFSLLFLFCSGVAVMAQSRYYDMWYFGGRHSLDFRNGTVNPSSASLETLEGCAVICDPVTGNPLFYTNGATVWNRLDNVMPNGTNLFGNLSCTQSSLIVPLPKNPSLYYIFTLDGTTMGGPRGPQGLGLCYSVVDMTLDNGLGGVVMKNIPLLRTASEKLTAVRHSNGCDYWIITHELGNDKFYAWLLTQDGLFAPPIVSAVGSLYSTLEAGYLKASPDGTRLFAAQSFIDYNSSYGELFRFNPSTGFVGPLLEAIPSGYGASFSPNNQYLYASRKDSLLQYDLQETPGQISSTARLLNSPDDERMLYGMQIAPNGKIYVVEGPVFTAFTSVNMNLGVVNNPDEAAPIAEYRKVFNYPGVNFFAGLPNCIDGYLGESEVGFLDTAEFSLEADDTVICAGERVHLKAKGGAWYKWVPAQGLDCDNCPDVVAEPQTTTTYTVWIYNENSCPSLYGMKVTIHVNEPEINAGPDTTICPGAQVQLHATGGTEHLWTPALGLSCTKCPDPIAAPLETTTYYVSGFNKDGCPNTDTIVVSVQTESPLSIEEDTIRIKCGEQVTLKGPKGTAYRWLPAEGLSCIDCAEPIASPTQTTTYYLDGTDSLGCAGSDRVTVIVSDEEVFAGADTSLCAGESVGLNATGRSEYRWSPSEGLSCTDCQNPVASPTETTSYIVQGSNNGQCLSFDTVVVAVHSLPKVDAGADTVLCLGDSIRLHGAGEGSLYWTPAINISCLYCSDPVISPHESMTYYLEVTSERGCIAWDSVRITVRHNEAVVASGDTTFCRGGSARLSAVGALRYRWSPSQGLSCTDCPDPVASPDQTTVYYVVGFNESGECASLDSVRVEIYPQPEVDAGADTVLCGGSTIKLHATGGATYRWDASPDLSCLDCAEPEATPTKTQTYYVTGFSPEGCESRDSVRVEVNALAGVDAGADTVLCGGSTIKLRATGGATYRWDASPDLSCLDCAEPEAAPTETRTYYVTGFSPEGCEGRDSVRVEIYPGVQVWAGADVTICSGEDVHLKATGGVRWLWEPPDGLSCTDCPDPTANPVQTTEYRVTAWNAEGCIAWDSLTVFVREEPMVIHLRIRRDYHGAIDSGLVIDVEAVDSIPETSITDLEFRLEYDSGVMRIDAESIERLLGETILAGWSVGVEQNGNGRLHLRLTSPPGTALHGKGDLLRLESYLYLSSVRGTELPFTVEPGNGCFIVVTEPGYAQIDSICGLNFRLIEITSQKYVPPVVWPNPARDRVHFEFGLGLDGPTQLELFDGLGKRVGVLVAEELSAGRYSVEWDVRGVSTGRYWYRLRSGDWSGGGEVQVEH